METDGYQAVLSTPELGPGAIAEVEAAGRHIVLLNVNQTYYALDGSCTADGTNLARAGTIQGETLVCSHDGAAFDVRSGARIDAPGDPLRRYAIQIEGNEIRVGPPLGD
jgi:nitrite reductase/ring-hydroxylating ferredoxin subunit